MRKKAIYRPNEPISDTHATPPKAMPDMNKARSAKEWPATKTNPFSGCRADQPHAERSRSIADVETRLRRPFGPGVSTYREDGCRIKSGMTPINRLFALRTC